MDTQSSVRRFPNSFSIENILSKPANKQVKPNYEMFSDVSSDRQSDNDRESLTDMDNSESARSREQNSDLRVSSPESNFTEDNLEDAKSDVASEDGITLDDDRKKRPRTAFSASQIKALETEFERGKYLSVAKRTALAKQLHLSETQIKIWFQNRRTKWKRKYTSDVETLASHYYAQLGIGGLARPMVVGDRLWLFSQTPAGPTPIQSIMLNGGGTAPPLPAAVRPYANAPGGAPLMPPMPSASVMESARNAILARGQPLNFGVPYSLAKQTPMAYMPGMSQAKPYVHTAAGRFIDYSAMPAASNPYQNAAARSVDATDAYLQLKYNALHNLALPPCGSEPETPACNGLAELQRVFGDTNANFLEHNSKSGGSGTSLNAKYPDYGHVSGGMTKKGRLNGPTDSDCSDIDCEQIDDDDDNAGNWHGKD